MLRVEPAGAGIRPSGVRLDHPFRGSAAVAAGLVTPKALRGPRFLRLFADVYVAADVEVDLALRSRAAHLLIAGRGALGGWSAAELLGASCGPADAPAEVVVPRGKQESRPGLLVRRDVLIRDEVADVGGCTVTTPLRTAYDLARRLPLVEAVVAVDTLTHAFRFAPAELVTFGYRHLGARGSRRLPEVVRLTEPLAESPMETRTRLALVLNGLPPPVSQFEVRADGRCYHLDLAYPEYRVAIEYDGGEHRTPERARRDLLRQGDLSEIGWKVVRPGAAVVLRRPRRVAEDVYRELERAAHRLGLPVITASVVPAR